MELLKKRIRLNKGNLSISELQVYDLLMSSPESFATFGIDEIANQCYVSTATVSRTIKKLGFRGMAQLKLEIDNQMNSHHVDQPLFNDPTSAVNYTIEGIDKSQLMKAVDLIKKSNICEFFGLGPSHALAVYGARGLVFSGKRATARAEWDELHMAANNVKKDDLVFLISASGESQVILDYATILKNREVPTIALIGNTESNLEKLVTLAFKTEIDNRYYKNIDITSRIPLMMVLEQLLLSYIKNDL